MLGSIYAISFIMLLLGISFVKFDKPKPKVKDIEFVLVDKEDTPINKNTKYRADINSRAGGHHDPTRKVSMPSPAPSAQQKPSAAAPQPKSQAKPQQQPKQQPKPAKNQQLLSKFNSKSTKQWRQNQRLSLLRQKRPSRQNHSRQQPGLL